LDFPLSIESQYLPGLRAKLGLFSEKAFYIAIFVLLFENFQKSTLTI